ncbi:MAG: hypothetical protein IT227_12140 [Flavobacteriales bacterium]|nr:hypothetical protein [Flavobacteriales bacterium]
MRRVIHGVWLMLCLGGNGSPSAAQSTTVRSDEKALVEELCGCVGAVDLAASNTNVERQVRSCLEGAVLRHPAGARSLLERPGAEASAGYKLGQVLGDALDRTCEAFGAVRDRLRQAHDAHLLKKGST